MGRPQKSDEWHALAGTKAKPNQRGERDRVPQAYAGRPRCPAHIKESETAFAAWSDAISIMRKNGTLSAGDAPTLAVYAVVYAKWVKASADVEERGFEIETTRTRRDGSEYTTSVVNPSVKIQTDSERQLLALAKALGLSPDSRGRIMPTKEAKPTKSKKWSPDQIVPGSIGEYMYKNGMLDENGKPKKKPQETVQ
jgi:P27 family predicted phage terminase small subunit